MGADTSVVKPVEAPPLKPLALKSKLAGTPARPPKYSVTIKNAKGEQVEEIRHGPRQADLKRAIVRRSDPHGIAKPLIGLIPQSKRFGGACGVIRQCRRSEFPDLLPPPVSESKLRSVRLLSCDVQPGCVDLEDFFSREALRLAELCRAMWRADSLRHSPGSSS